MGLERSEVIVALANMVYGVLHKQNPWAYSTTQIYEVRIKKILFSNKSGGKYVHHTHGAMYTWTHAVAGLVGSRGPTWGIGPFIGYGYYIDSRGSCTA